MPTYPARKHTRAQAAGAQCLRAPAARACQWARALPHVGGSGKAAARGRGGRGVYSVCAWEQASGLATYHRGINTQHQAPPPPPIAPHLSTTQGRNKICTFWQTTPPQFAPLNRLQTVLVEHVCYKEAMMPKVKRYPYTKAGKAAAKKARKKKKRAS